MTVSRSLLLLATVCALSAPERARAQSAPFERRPFLVLNGGFGVQGSGESGASQQGGPQASVGVGVRVARAVALRAEYGGQWFLRGAQPVDPCCNAVPDARDLRGAHLLAELHPRAAPGARTVAYVLAGPSLVWVPNDQASPNALFSPVARRASGATVGVGLGLRSAPRSDRGLRLEARYTALTHSVAATHSLFGLGLGLWL